MPDGTLEPVRCGASNRCDYCAMFATIETALLLELDAKMRMPTVGITTTTRRPGYSMIDFRKAEALLWKQLRRELEPKGLKPRKQITRGDPERLELVEYCGFMEWTTGDGERAAGVRRPHCHHLTKGISTENPLLTPIPLEDVDPSHAFRQGRHVQPGETTTELELRIAELWHRFTGDAFIVECRPLRTPAGAIVYLAMHHRKKPQAPPPGFTGRRLRPSKLYLEQPNPEMRALARQLATQRRVWRAVNKVIAAELYDEEERAADEMLTSALVDGLRSLAREPLELQMDLDGHVDHEAEREELARRTAAALKRLRAECPPELVRVRERLEVDRDTGVAVWRATAVLGPA